MLSERSEFIFVQRKQWNFSGFRRSGELFLFLFFAVKKEKVT